MQRLSQEDQDKKRKAEKLEEDEKHVVKAQIKTAKDNLLKIVNLSKKIKKEEAILQEMEGLSFPSGIRPFKF